jgi:enoyl-CoA hydratase/carnithine racemase
MELTSQAVRYEVDSGVTHITFSAPDTGNALNGSMLQAFSESLKAAIADQDCRAIVIAAEGTDFSTGMDFGAVFAQGSRPDLEPLKLFLECLFLIHRSPQPVIACIEGNVTGGGVGIVTACDLAIASGEVVFMLSEVVVGMIPAIITPFLLRRLSPAQVKYMTLSSRGMSALEAKNMGLVDEIAVDGMNHTVKRQLQRLFRSSPEALAASKQYFDALIGGDLNRQTDIAMQRLLSWFEQPNVSEAIHSFSEGFSPSWFQKYRGHRYD